MKRFKIDYAVRVDDLNFAGHVGNAQWLTIMERARVDMLAECGIPFASLLERGLSAVVAAVHIRYASPARLSDVMSVNLRVTAIDSGGMQLAYNIRGADGRPFVRAELSLVFVDLAGIPVPIPDDLLCVLAERTP